MKSKDGQRDMGNQPLKGLARFVAAYRNSKAGFRDAWSDEEAFRYEVVALVLSIPVAWFFAGSVFQWALLVASVLLVVIVEVLNSAIENVVDRIGPERHENARKAKDMGSLAVLLACGFAGIIWVAAIWQSLWGS
ncbi:MAG: diacylglycerol kinase [Pseudomonadota bacterium]